MKPVSSLICLLTMLCSPVMAGAETLAESIAADYQSRLEPLFKHFHAHPELSGLEFETARRMAAELRDLGYR